MRQSDIRTLLAFPKMSQYQRSTASVIWAYFPSSNTLGSPHSFCPAESVLLRTMNVVSPTSPSPPPPSPSSFSTKENVCFQRQRRRRNNHRRGRRRSGGDGGGGGRGSRGGGGGGRFEQPDEDCATRAPRAATPRHLEIPGMRLGDATQECETAIW